MPNEILNEMKENAKAIQVTRIYTIRAGRETLRCSIT